MDGPVDHAPRFSVVLNTYNRADLVGDAARRVLEQDFGDFELIVVDDGSTDATPDIVSGIDDLRLRFIRRENGGLAVARNTGLRAARGEIIVFLDDDDCVTESWLGRFATALSDLDVGMASCGARFVDGEGCVAEVRYPEPLGPAFDDQTALFLAGCFAVRRSIVEAVGGYWEALRCSEQTELGLRLTAHCVGSGLRCAVIDETLIDLHRPAEEHRPLRRPDYLREGSLLVLERHGEKLDRDPRLASNFYGIAGVQSARLGDYAAARRNLWRAVRRSPAMLRNHMRLALALIPPLARCKWPVWKPAR